MAGRSERQVITQPRWLLMGACWPLPPRDPAAPRIVPLPVARWYPGAQPARTCSGTQITEIFRVDVPATFLFPGVGTVLARRRVHGLSRPWRADPIVHIDELWLEDGSGS